MRDRLSRRPLAAAALGLVGAEAALALAGARLPGLSALVLVAAPGLALLPLLPRRLRTTVVGALAAAPALGFAASSVALITVASLGIGLDGLSSRLAVLAVVAAGLMVAGDGEPQLRLGPGAAAGAAGLLAAVGVGVVLQERVIGGAPVPGNDWAKYVLYADEIRRQGALLIDNPFWMLGVPFREDPGVPALYGSFLAMTGEPATVLMHGIWVFAVMGILSTYALVRAWWGEVAGVLAAGLVAVLPINLDMLGWHGLANSAALALMPLLLLALTALVSGGLDRREAAGAGLLLVALAAAHRLSFTVFIGALALALALALIRRAGRGAVLRGAGMVALAAGALGGGVAYDIVSRRRTFGGTQDHTAYLFSKVDLGLVARDLSVPFTLAALLAVGLAVRWARRERALVPLLATLAVVVALGYAWLAHLPLVYFRMAYFLPLALAPLVAIALSRLPGRRSGAVAGAGLIAVIAVVSFGQAPNVREQYGFAGPAALRGLDAVAAASAPGEVVVTDRCWSFLATWFLHTRTLPALEPEDIQPKAELRVARQAKAVLGGTREGRSLARRLGARFAVVDPTCPDERERAAVPAWGDPVYVSERLVVLRLDAPPG